ncbi:MAG: hypothetical protein PF482_11640 [Desulfobacteraceae bacterium]|jgi:hypothetical protein|nr:hypothetical protein [Desulfobacteraceae bacterium]
MFTDTPATPVRVEVLLDVLMQYPNGLKRDVIYNLLQPIRLSGGGQGTAKDTISAALQLGLAIEKRQSTITLSTEYNNKKSPQYNILKAADSKILASLEVEYHLALFYAYYLGVDKEVYKRSIFNREDWVNQFNKDVFNNEPQNNQFNTTKHTGLDRWLSYLGLGWYDPSDQFQANPYKRIYRSLPIVFGGKSKMDGDQFIDKLGEVCPELDGGHLFLQANKYRNYSPKAKQCTLGLSHALVDLHEDGIIKLDCPVDSRGWNIVLAQPSRDDTIKSDRITLVELRK